MKALITGSQGFVGRYLWQELEQNGYEVMGLDIAPGEKTVQADILNSREMERVVAALVPDVVFHLAGQPDVGLSWKEPKRTMEVNVIGALNLLEAVRAYKKDVTILLVGSSDQYGVLGEYGQRVTEDIETKPRSPYGVSKKSQEELAGVYAKNYGMNICMTRSFNHGGEGQREGFLISDFAAGIARVEKGLEPSLKVGNLEAKRDFTHVKDIVRAYRLITEKGRPGEVYNVGSGTVHSAQEILDRLLKMTPDSILVEQDPMRLRPSDTPIICCDHSKLTRDTGWEAEIPLETVLSDALAGWRKLL